MNQARIVFGVWLVGTLILMGVAGVALTKQFRRAGSVPLAKPATERSVVGGTLSEKEKIAALLDDLAGSDAKFVRNGTEYSGADAADHLRRKWRAAGDRVTTAREFIELLASQSSSSGQAYLVREDEVTIESGPWFVARLERIERAGEGVATKPAQIISESSDGAGTVLALLRAAPERFRIVESDEIEFYSGRELARRIGLKHVLAGAPAMTVDKFVDRFCTISSLHGTRYEVDETPPVALADWLRAKVVR